MLGRRSTGGPSTGRQPENDPSGSVTSALRGLKMAREDSPKRRKLDADRFVPSMSVGPGGKHFFTPRSQRGNASEKYSTNSRSSTPLGVRNGASTPRQG